MALFLSQQAHQRRRAGMRGGFSGVLWPPLVMLVVGHNIPVAAHFRTFTAAKKLPNGVGQIVISFNYIGATHAIARGN